MDSQQLHHLRNDLNVVSLGLSLLKRQLNGNVPSEALNTLRHIEQAVQRCGSAVRPQQISTKR